MAYELTFTPRFQKHFRKLTTQEKSQLKIKLELLAKNPSHPSLRTRRIQGTSDYTKAVLILRQYLHLYI